MKNALIGYSYQNHVALLMLVKMDVERKINHIILEANVNHKFDDISVNIDTEQYYLQIKDIDNLDINAIKVSENAISIRGKLHPLSEAINVLFVKEITLQPDSEVFGYPAQRIENVYVISLSRLEIDNHIQDLYQTDPRRKNSIDQFLSDKLDKRIFNFSKHELPAIFTFNTELFEPTIVLTRTVLEVQDILLIEGKPGVGKSHLVGFLQNQFKKNTLYRFWISNQDRDYQERLKFQHFINDLAKKTFFDLKPYTEEQIIDQLHSQGTTVIIDGLDHVENYNPMELEDFIAFINKLHIKCKTIVLSRPLQRSLSWEHQTLPNWNRNQTIEILRALYHIDFYTESEQIYRITQGYPILVRYLAEQYKKDGKIPAFEQFDTVDSYYDELIRQQKSKQALALFLCCRAFFMDSEIGYFLDEQNALFVKEFVLEHPYLFERRLNRLSLFHDSFITYLRKSNISYTVLLNKVNELVYQSLIRGEKRFQSRLNTFDLPVDHLKIILKQYSNISNFQKMMVGVIDFEAIQAFYVQLRELLEIIPSEELEIGQYYDLALILNMVTRGHISALSAFRYTYTLSLLKHGYSEEDITSSRYLLAMLVYIRSQDATLLVNATSNELYDTSRFYRELEAHIEEEDEYFNLHDNPLNKAEIEEILASTKSWELKESLPYILEDLYIHVEQREAFPELYAIINNYTNGNELQAISALDRIFIKKGVEAARPEWMLEDVKKNLLSLGLLSEVNDYLNLSLREYQDKHKAKGSFKLWPEMLSYIRLALHQDRIIDIASIASFWIKYYQRNDHSLTSLDVALPVFEQLNFVEWQDSIRLIYELQYISEKGYKSLLANYFLQNSAEFLAHILDHTDPKHMIISWFKLPAEYINVLPEKVYEIAMNDLIRRHQYDGQVPFDEVEQLIKSNKLRAFKSDIDLFRYVITIPAADPCINLLKQHRIRYHEQATEKSSYREESTPQSRYLQGILDKKNEEIILQEKLSPSQVAALSDGYYSALVNPEIFRQFPSVEIQSQIKSILQQAIVGKSKLSGTGHNLWYLPGNIIKIFHNHQIPVDFNKLFDSFNLFLEMSQFEIRKNNKK